MEAAFRAKTGNYTSERTVQNAYYEIRAVGVLGLHVDADVTPYLWLASPGCKKGESECRYYRRSILAELGRFKDDEDIRLFAEIICEWKPKAKHAIALLRSWRIEK
jgi:hypothetical protein